ncbi:NAD(P)H-binding protein [Streptosporangium sp. NPDC000239]|uniref:NAD-dependent epimerase/dehydratase family protein n=1 Tax=Streptosporangium sp. NPDC000239 TaxID=3154248 RepID=UPI003327DCAE
MIRTVLVTGARGKTGREVAARLRRFGILVHAGSSQPARMSDTRTDPVRFDWHDRATWREAAAAVDAIYLMRPDYPTAPELVADLVEVNPDAHVVLLSEQGAETLSPDHWARRVEDAVVTRAASWTLLRPSWFHQVLTDSRFYRDAIRDDRVLSLPSGGAPIAWVDARDIADVAVAALRAPEDHHGRAHTITGPDPVPVANVAQELSARLGHRIRAEDPSPRETLDGLDPWMADILDDLYHRVRHGGFSRLSPAVKQITGHEPTSIGEFINAHLDQWRRSPMSAP